MLTKHTFAEKGNNFEGKQLTNLPISFRFVHKISFLIAYFVINLRKLENLELFLDYQLCVPKEIAVKERHFNLWTETHTQKVTHF